MGENGKSAIQAALVGGIFAVVAAVLGAFVGYWIASPGADRLRQIEADTARDLATYFSEFIASRERLVRHLKGEPQEKAPEEEINKYVEEAKKLDQQWRTSTVALAAALRFAEHNFDEGVQSLASEFIEWHAEQEAARAGKAITEWVDTSKYQDWRDRILKATSQAVR